ncbi:hypothetical protein [Seonamhaeicola marinus]|uniref:Uncharacterized protein n=1 Tax=Seonamhaeicola marinus TaxID=1912246 RepID=A0A5D0HJQ0_9FLAO|nr:hypothetical protein [Seonamhaeicola marinus]TYA71613.1 hypothetical protein FUA24_18750 [Seonamhaeicola marinus]
MKKFYFYVIVSIVFIIHLNSCGREVCRECIKCISFDDQDKIINEVRECNPDTTYLNGFKTGFIDGANEQGWNATCVNLGVICECEK